MTTQEILKAEGVVRSETCVVCTDNFIDMDDFDKYDEFLSKMNKKYKLPEDFENETVIRWWCDRHECLVCHATVCDNCVHDQNWLDHESDKWVDGAATWWSAREGTDVYEVVYRTPSVYETGIIPCPICRTKDYRFKYCPYGVEWLPIEVLNDIKHLAKNTPPNERLKVFVERK